MNINELTIGQVQQIMTMFAAAQPPQSDSQSTYFIGRYCVVRCKDAGVHAGKVVEYSGRSCTLKDARRLWYWSRQMAQHFFLVSPAKGCTRIARSALR